MRVTRKGVISALAMAILGTVGCFHAQTNAVGPDGMAMGMGPVPPHGAPPITVPPPGAVPVELQKITLPPYVIEAPDNLLIEVIQKGVFPVEVDGKLVEVKDKDGKSIPDPSSPTGFKLLTREGTQRLPIQPISGPFQVRIDGTVGLGYWGSVTVAGVTLDQAAESIRQHLLRSESLRNLGTKPESLIVIVDVLAYNSKRYYVITDGGGYGEQVYPFPIYGSETVLDALSNIMGLPTVASRRNIWVARRTPHPGQPWQILPVDWVGITQHGITTTNYQIMPGDRIYVKAQRIITIDTTLARIISPIERLLGITLLGTSTYNQISGRGNGFNGNN